MICCLFFLGDGTTYSVFSINSVILDNGHKGVVFLRLHTFRVFVTGVVTSAMTSSRHALTPPTVSSPTAQGEFTKMVFTQVPIVKKTFVNSIALDTN